MAGKEVNTMDFRLKTEKKILVIGGTGNQGRAVADHLAAAGWPVRALVRNPDKPAARALAWKGIELIKGDLNDRSSLDRALAGVYGLFAVFSWQGGVAQEIEQGKRLIDAARAAGVRHTVYSSVGGAERRTGIPHFDSKWQIEEHLRASGMPATVVRPVFLMYNFSRPETRSAILRGTLSMALPPDRKLQMLAVDDLAAYVADAFEEPESFIGTAVELAGDELTMRETAAVFSRALGRPVRFVELPIAELRKRSVESALMMEWFDRRGYRADIARLRTVRPQLMTLEGWLRSEQAGWVVRQAA